jgi:hypothetical protein
LLLPLLLPLLLHVPPYSFIHCSVARLPRQVQQHRAVARHKRGSSRRHSVLAVYVRWEVDLLAA